MLSSSLKEDETVAQIAKWLRWINHDWAAYCEAGLFLPSECDDDEDTLENLAKALERGEWKKTP
jgi:hypothetical protein